MRIKEDYVFGKAKKARFFEVSSIMPKATANKKVLILESFEFVNQERYNSDMKFANFDQALDFLYSRIPTQEKVKYQGSLGLERTVEFLKLLGSPQNKLKVIHLAGTSGKGSTAYLISHLLKNLGFKVGLHISPHLLDIRERFQINNELISKEKFVDYLNQIMPAYEQMGDTKYGFPSYFEIGTALSFYISFKERVDYQVSETGVGGLYDATNSVDNPSKVAVITKIGLDHTKILGNAIGKIALQKAEIIHQNNLVISTWQKASARKVIEKIVNERSARLFWVKAKENFRNIKTSAKNTVFDFQAGDAKLKNLELSMLGSYQVENASTALTTVYLLSHRDQFDFDETKIRNAFKNAHFAGRFDIQHIQEKMVVLDGAHNPQKMRSFLQSVDKVFPNQKFNFLIAFKMDKDFTQMLKMIKKYTRTVFVTSFFMPKQDWVSLSKEPQEIANQLKKLGFEDVKVIPDTKQAFEQAVEKSDKLIVTGSLYLLSDIYKILDKN